jgi:hypothetical protein
MRRTPPVLFYLASAFFQRYLMGNKRRKLPMNVSVPVTATGHGFQFVCPFCRRAVVDIGDYAESTCRHEFEVVIVDGNRRAVFIEPASQRIAA